MPSKAVTQLKQRTSPWIASVPAESNPLLSVINFFGGEDGEGKQKAAGTVTEGVGGSWAGAASRLLSPASQEIRSGTDYFCPSFVGHL